jgi:hypothetical protein
MGNWKALGGTGIFEGATGSGTVDTVGQPQDMTTGQIKSISMYTGMLTLD